MSKGIGKNIKVRVDQVAFIVSLVKRLSTDIVVIIIFVYKGSIHILLFAYGFSYICLVLPTYGK